MDPDPYPDGDTGNTCLGGGRYCPSASSFFLSFNVNFNDVDLRAPKI